jgi:hypothetical protein
MTYVWQFSPYSAKREMADDLDVLRFLKYR